MSHQTLNTIDNTLGLWNALTPVDRKFTKQITGKSYKGDSPNPTYIIWKLTQELGPIGRNWGFNVKFDNVRLGAPHQVVVEEEIEMRDDLDANGNARAKSKRTRYEIIREEYHEVCISFWFLTKEGDGRTTFDSYGGTPMLYMTKSGRWMHDEDAAKKSLTDAYTKGASWLGACADIFLGIFDDKYSSADDGPANQSEKPAAPRQQASDTSHDEAWPTQDSGQQHSGNRANSAPNGW